MFHFFLEKLKLLFNVTFGRHKNLKMIVYFLFIVMFQAIWDLNI